MTIAQALNERDTNKVCIGEADLLLDCSGCLFWPEEKTLVFSDLHFEKGSSFAKKGQLIPPFDTGATLRLMMNRIEYWQPNRVISLGDSFHDDEAANRLPPLYLNQLTGLTRKFDWIWISGNHDPSPPAGIGGECFDEMAIGGLTFRHEPADKKSGLSNGEIAGHLHPVGKIRRRSKSVRRRCFIEDGERLIMPAFGAFTGGLNVRDRAYGDLFNWPDVNAHLIGRDKIYPITAQHLVL